MAEKEQKSAITPELVELMAHFAREMKKPDEETQAKLDAEKAKKIANAKAAAESAKYEMEQRAAAQRNCQHHNGKHPLFVGQVLTCRDVTAICLRCGVEYRFSADALGSGERDFRMSEAVLSFGPGQTEAWLENLEKQYPPKIKAHRVVELASK